MTCTSTSTTMGYLDYLPKKKKKMTQSCIDHCLSKASSCWYAHKKS